MAEEIESELSQEVVAYIGALKGQVERLTGELSQAKADLAKEKENHKETSECFGIERRRADTAEARAERAEAALKQQLKRVTLSFRCYACAKISNGERAQCFNCWKSTELKLNGVLAASEAMDKERNDAHKALAKSEALAEERGRVKDAAVAMLRKLQTALTLTGHVCGIGPCRLCSVSVEAVGFLTRNPEPKALTPEPAKEDGNNG